jgi:anti-sigma regulatory factor (Ser/Thr protein kinase)
MGGSTLRLRISSETDATRSLIAASHFAEEIGFLRSDCQGISTAVSELAKNILKYAGDGEIIIERIGTGRRPGMQVTARDRGPGIEDIDAAMSDHFSSSGTLGLGLPGVKRLMDDFEIESTPGKGTRVVIRKWREARSKPVRSVLLDAAKRASLHRNRESSEGTLPREEAIPRSHVDCAFFVRPCRGERVSGDIVVVEQRDGDVFIAVVDALGHGPAAHAIADRAARFLKRSWRSDLARTMRELHETLRGTDGAAAGLCIVEVGRRQARYVGVGNTVIRTLGDAGKTAFSTPGTLGHQIRTPREQPLAIDAGEVLVLYTDGVKEQFEIEDYPQLRYQDARTIARTIVTRYGKDHDDASCAVLRYEG